MKGLWWFVKVERVEEWFEEGGRAGMVDVLATTCIIMGERYA